MELGGRVVRVLDSGQLHQSERSWVRFLDGPLKKKLPGLRTVAELYPGNIEILA